MPALAELHEADPGLTVFTERLMLIPAFDPAGYCWPEPEREAEHTRHLASVRELTAKLRNSLQLILSRGIG